MALLLRVDVETGREVARERTPDDHGDDVVGGAQARAGMD